MEANDEDNDAAETHDDDEAEKMCITGDVSSVHVIGLKMKPRSIRLTGSIQDSPVRVLIDGGSTHNFVKPTVVEKLSLPIHFVSPFRVFVGNGQSLRCSYACLSTPILLQGHQFNIDLFILQVEGPDVILGVQWLQELGDVTKNYRNLTMKFNCDDRRVFLQGENAPPVQISYNALFTLFDSK